MSSINGLATIVSGNLGTSVPLAAFVLLLSWRLWKFTIRPILRPNEPRELPYWIPILGHVVGFFRDSGAIMERGRLYFKDSREPFALTVAGQTIYIITSPHDVSTQYKSSHSISLDPIAADMYSSMGVSARSVKAMFTAGGSNSDLPNSKTQHANNLMLALYRQQFHPGELCEDLVTKRTLPEMLRRMHLLGSQKEHPSILSRSGDSSTVSLLQLCADVFITGPTESMFGKTIWKTQPDLLKWFMVWEHTSWKFLFQLPPALARDLESAKAVLVDAFAGYVSLPEAEREDAVFWVKETVKLFEKTGLSPREIGMVLSLQYWAIIGNVYKLAFWVVAYLVHDPTLLSLIRDEVAPTVKENVIDEVRLRDNCPLLESIVSEVQRLTLSSPLGRVVTSPVVIGGKLLKPGNKMMVPFRQLHLNKAVWGPEPLDLDPRRFQENPKLAKSPSYRPWGGGHSMCPGRFLAKRSIYAFIALLLARYEVSVETLDGSEPLFPKGDGTKPSPGVEAIAEGEDVVLKLERRSK